MSSPAWRAIAEAVDLPAPHPGALAVVRRLKALGYEAWLVGGGVRDRLIGRPVSDWDVASDAAPRRVADSFSKVIETGLQHGTVTVMADDEPIEVTTYRVEAGYSDGRRPDAVAFTRSLVDDLSRRDFTINALAWDPDAGLLVDPFGGRADLAARIIRCVGRAEARFGEDGLRPLRAVRFAAVLQFALDAETAAAIPATLATFERIAAERVRVELFKLLLAPGVRQGLELLRETGLLAAVLPDLAALAAVDWTATVETAAACPTQLSPRLAALLWRCPGDLDAALRALKCANDERREVLHLLGQRTVPTGTDAEVRAAVAQIGRDAWPAWLALAEALERAGQLTGVGAFATRVVALGALDGPLVARDLALDGRAVAGILNEPPSRRIGRVLDGLLARVWAEPTGNTVAQLTAWVPEVAAALDGAPAPEAANR